MRRNDIESVTTTVIEGGALVVEDQPTTSFALLAGVAAQSFSDVDSAIDAILRTAREVFGLSTALVVNTENGEWRAERVSEDADRGWNLRPGDILPFDDTY